MDADRVIKSKAVLKQRGLIGDVVLLAMPAGPRIDGLFIKPSVTNKELAVDVELADLKSAGPAKLTASAVNTKTGETEKTWELDVTLPAPHKSGLTVLRDVKLPWENPKIWDFGQPNLYTLRLGIDGDGVKDDFAQRFGFREFRIAGRQFLLNGRPYNFRLHLLEENTPMREAIAARIDALLAANFNIAEIWPDPDLRRGHANFRPLIASVADEKGLPLLYPLGDPSGMFDPTGTEVAPEKIEAWRKVLSNQWKRVRNSPSALVFMLAGNRFSHPDDQNPLRIGNREKLSFGPVWQRTKAEPGWKLINELKALDPSRPVTSHHNANVGDFHTSNNYLNLHPLQEREDWLSVWAESGDLPYSAVEFDAPFDATLTRGRKGHQGASTTEPWLTEFLAIYDGPAAYANEDPAYRSMIARAFKAGQDYQGVEVTSSKAFSPFAAWWITRTLRAWRGHGLSGGMVHWANAYGWRNKPDADNTYKFPQPEPGSRGAWTPKMMRRLALGSLHPDVAVRTPAGDALVAGLSPTLSWIAGPPDAFTDQSHIFSPGEKIVRSAALLNDTAVPLPYTVEWTAEAGGKPVGEGKSSGTVPVGIPEFAPIEFAAPAVTARTDGTIKLRTTIGETTHEDTWAFRVLPPAPTDAVAVAAYDPEGTTTKWLEETGSKVTPVTAASIPSSGVLVIGRNAIVKTPAAEWSAMRGKIEAFLAGGGRVLLMAQDPEWLREMSGLRVARHVGRRFWPVPTQSAHPLVSGLDGNDFRDWRGAGTFVDPAPTTALDRPVPTPPKFGWHVNNSGSVASAPLEKPHFGRWTPLLEGEFDLAFTPLMEARLGKGLLVWCGLDLDGRTATEPAAFSRRLLTYLAGPLPPAVPQEPAIYIGGPAGEKLLTSMGLQFTKAASLPSRPGLVILGEGDTAPADAALDAFVKNGGRIVLLGPAAAKLGFALAPKKLGGAATPPDWPEARGLSPSDLRLRSDFQSPLLVEGPNEVAANGLLGRKAAGRGVAVAFPLTPDLLPAREKTYFRFSQWRLTRALSQVLANLGGMFKADGEFFDFKPHDVQPVALSGEWKIQDELLLPSAGSPDNPSVDPGRDPKTAGWEQPGFDDSKWKAITLPMETEKAIPAFADKDGAFWFRRTFEVPADYASKPLLLRLGKVDDFDEVWVNGTRIGGTPYGTKDAWNLKREFKIRPGLLKAGTNTIAVRCFDQFGGGGFTETSPDAMQLELARPPARPTPYVEGFRNDHELGDDYARYYRW